MKIYKQDAYNQELSKSKLISSVSGVGSIVTSKFGYYILVCSTEKWPFLASANSQVATLLSTSTDINSRYDDAKLAIETHVGVKVISDKRFVDFLRNQKQLSHLMCLIDIPSINLNDTYNTLEWEKHPINLKLKSSNPYAEVSGVFFTVPGTHFPRWFKNKSSFKPYSQWRSMWEQNSQLKLENFVPPRDVTNPKKVIKKIKGKNVEVTEYPLLEQINLILVCGNGHLSDIPWPKFLNWKSTKGSRSERSSDLFSLPDCCSSPDLIWTENRTKSEGYKSIFLECKSCLKGSGNENNPKINLEGINNIKPLCPGHKPWEIDNHSQAPYEICSYNGQRLTMNLALATGNSIYFSNTFSSLFLPSELSGAIKPNLERKLQYIQNAFSKWQARYPSKTKNDFINERFNSDEFLIDDAGFSEETLENDKLDVLEHFNSPPVLDPKENYRFTEYKCFTRNDLSLHPELTFSKGRLDSELLPYFDRIVVVSNLKVTQAQLEFSRVEPVSNTENSFASQNIYSSREENVHVLPANGVFGEGIFLQLSENRLMDWLSLNESKFKNRYRKYLRVIRPNEDGISSKLKINTYQDCVKYFLIHSLSHALMRGLEFSCGYPTASLKERLYISDRMCGILIYTAEGAEGSMGGLINQASIPNFKKLLLESLRRAQHCTSDPICWESEGQGLFELNQAACFSCSLLSEVSCEEMNLILDRLTLVDEDFGFFKDCIKD